MRHAGQQLDNPTLILRGFFAAPPTFTETPPQYIEAKEGGSITMTCTAFGNPKPIVTWLKEGTLLAASGKYRVSVVLCWIRKVLLLSVTGCIDSVGSIGYSSTLGLFENLNKVFISGYCFCPQ